MKSSDSLHLMYAVLDGEATPAEAGELDRLLAADPDVRAQFDELTRLFDGLGRMPKAFPPEGLVAAVIARLPQPPPRRDRLRQLFSPSRVIRPSLTEARGIDPGSAIRVHRGSESGPHLRGENMSEKIGSKRKVWIGISIAVAAVVVASQYVDFPPSGKDATGTIVPAQRFRAEQPTAADVKLGAPTGGGQTASTGTSALGDAARGDAAKGDAAKGDAAKGDAAKGDAAKGDVAKGDAAKGDAAKGDAAKGDAAKGDAAKGDAAKGDAAKGDAAKGDAAKGDAAKGDAAKGDAAKGDAAKGDAAKGDAAKGDAAKGDAAKGDAAKGDAAKGDAAKGDAARGDAARGDAAKGDAAKKGK